MSRQGQNSGLTKSGSLTQSQVGKKASPSGRGTFDLEAFTRPGVTAEDVREVKEVRIPFLNLGIRLLR